MSKEAMKQALEALKNNRRKHYGCEDTWYSCPKHEDGCFDEHAGSECNCGADEANVEIDAAIKVLQEAPAEQCRTDGRCQYAIDVGTEGWGRCPKGKCVMPAQQEPVAWMKPHPRCDSACLFQCTHGFTRFPECVTPSARPWVGLTDDDEVLYPYPPAKPPIYATAKNTKSVRDGYELGGYEKEAGYYSEQQLDEFAKAIEAKLKEKNI